MKKLFAVLSVLAVMAIATDVEAQYRPEPVVWGEVMPVETLPPQDVGCVQAQEWQVGFLFMASLAGAFGTALLYDSYRAEIAMPPMVLTGETSEWAEGFRAGQSRRGRTEGAWAVAVGTTTVGLLVGTFKAAIGHNRATNAYNACVRAKRL